MTKENVVICPPCGENVASATKRGANKVLPILPRLPRLTAVLPPQGREITTRGFTLIELLVVVLIIGILAAVAVPQYQLAVEKSRATEAITYVKALAQAEKVYFLANGKYTPQLSDLDIAPSEPTDTFSTPYWGFTLRHANDITWPRIYATKEKGGYSRYIYYSLSSSQLICATNTNDTQWKNICKNLTTEEGYACPWDNSLLCYLI